MNRTKNVTKAKKQGISLTCSKIPNYSLRKREHEKGKIELLYEFEISVMFVCGYRKKVNALVVPPYERCLTHKGGILGPSLALLMNI